MPHKDLKKRRLYARDYGRKWRKENPEASRLKSKISRWKRVYGIDLTPEQYDVLFEAQNGVCAICGNPETKNRSLHVDHDHVTGRIRALLCGKCNRGLGYLCDSSVLLRKAAEYLERHGK